LSAQCEVRDRLVAERRTSLQERLHKLVMSIWMPLPNTPSEGSATNEPPFGTPTTQPAF
jgi:hypothetical protein